MAMSQKERKQLMGLLIAVPLLGIVAFWMYYRTPTQTRVAELEQTIDSLESAVDSAREELRRGSVEELRRRVATYQQSLGLMRQLVPTDNEVANLIDDISNRAKLRNVTVANFTRMSSEFDGRYRVDRYQWRVYGNYDEVGAFLSDIAALPRIMVPYQVTVGLATDRDVTTLADTTGSLLEVNFQLRTFVKQPMAEEEISGDR